MSVTLTPLGYEYTEGLITRENIETVYTSIKTNGFVVAMYSISIIVASGIAIYQIIDVFRKGLEDGEKDKPIDIKIYFKMLQPMLRFYLLGLSIPIIILLVEVFFSTLEEKALGATMQKPLMDIVDYIASEYTYYMQDMDKLSIYNLSLLIVIIKRAFILFLLAPIGMAIDNYMYSFALVGRYFYLLLLELVAPFAIMSALFSETKSFFIAWIKNMFVCYMLIPAFMLANFIVLSLSHMFLGADDVGIGLFIILLMLKLFLYKKVTLVRNLIS